MKGPETRDLQERGLEPQKIHWNLAEPGLYEATVLRGTGRIATGGPLVVDTTPYTGRSPNDKFVTRPSSSSNSSLSA